MYVFSTIAPQRMSKIIPKVKLILLLRNPIDRAYSHYNMQKRNNYEKLSFEDAIKLEKERIKDERQKEILDENFVGINLRDFSYLSRGEYDLQLETWLKYFPRNQLLIIRTEDLENDHQKTMNIIFEFLELPKYEIKNFQKANVGEYNKMNPNTRKFLVEYFKPHNANLSKLLGMDFSWDC